MLTNTQITELIKCRENPVHFISSYVNELNYAQEHLVRHFQEHRFSIAKAPRASGKTLTGLASVLHFVTFNDNVTSGILTSKDREASLILSSLKHMISNLPDLVRPETLAATEREIVFRNGSKVRSLPVSSVGDPFPRFDLWYIDEFANHKEAEILRFWEKLSQRFHLANPPKVLISSSPFKQIHKIVVSVNEYGEVETTAIPTLFHNLWQNSEKGVGRFSPVRVYWNQLPGVDETWKQKKIKDLGVNCWEQQYECKFGRFQHSNQILTAISELENYS